MTALARIDVDRLAKLCGMFSSEHDGERASAAAFADRLVRSAGLTWPEVLSRQPEVAGGDYQGTSRRREVPPTPGELLAWHGHRLTAWERNFLGGIVKRQAPLTWKQTAALNEIRARFGGAPA